MRHYCDRVSAGRRCDITVIGLVQAEDETLVIGLVQAGLVQAEDATVIGLVQAEDVTLL